MAGRLLSVNVGLPREVEWEGKTVRTAIWKAPVDGPRMVRRSTSTATARATSRARRRAPGGAGLPDRRRTGTGSASSGATTSTYGQFGENFTVDGLPDDEVCIGDRYRIGGAVFEVTQPRVTCYRVGMRMDEPRDAALLVAHHRPGFYLRVLEEGEVQAGDEIVKVAAGPERDDGRRRRRAALPARAAPARPARRRAAHPGAEPGLEGFLQRCSTRRAGGAGERQPRADRRSRSPPPAWSGFRPLRVVDVAPESTSIASFRLAPADGAPLPPARAGQFLTVRLRLDAGRRRR